MSFIKKNLSTIIAIGVFIVVLVLLIQLKNTFFPNEKSAIYGDRLKGIEKVKIDEDNMEDDISKQLGDSTSSVTVRVAGRIVNVLITANSDVDLETAKGYGKDLLEKFSTDEKKFYDFQVFVIKKEDSKQFPIIGYRQHTKEDFTWTKDRTESE